ncbi:MBL fold metallo-hydrolase (plasmid) [Novosphingobium resinovorum]|uniref:MBL fold metallo-hydrolase n=1 Tax=Novosphingobium TaxID=165696 RepID=UPI001B3C5D9F|nr:MULTISPECIES: MBL fold metallo-hydrolase [Novosphingobium]MBF7015314.1 MBL fold metallo-hydrolase [Novosphingobium sp. HR1a]WJM29993.1 MBL fold metallo-hydrolase [Novosphingobium resinovorum]
MHSAVTRVLVSLLMLAASQTSVAAQPVSGEKSPGTGLRWITLGTMGGPIASSERSQPANLLLLGDDAYLVDCGDGAIEQLAKAGLRLPQVRAVVLSHLHFDHTAGLAAVLGLRFQTNVTQRLAIYGPPGTKRFVDGLLASMRPAVEAGYGMPGEPSFDPASTVEVTELDDRSTFALGRVVARAVRNTHYSFAPGSAAERRFQSFAFRFDAPGRSIVYTGDTGPSPAVESLARDADLLISEMIDVPGTIANVRRNTPDMSEAAMSGLREHLTRHHLTSEQVGQLAARAHVKAVVVTHVVAPSASAGDLLGYVEQIGVPFAGGVVVAADLDTF